MSLPPSGQPSRSSPALERRFIETNNGKIEIATTPTPSTAEPTLVFLHDALGCIDSWQTFPATLSASCGYPVLLYSRLGHGRSEHGTTSKDKSIHFLHHEANDILPQVLRAANTRRFILVGHSDGASISLLYAAGRPTEDLLGLVLLAPHTFAEPGCQPALLQARQEFENGDLRRSLTLYHGANTDHVFYAWNDRWLNPAFSHWDIRNELARVNAPCLIVQGQRDPFGTIEQAHSIRDRVVQPCDILMLESAGHFPHKEVTEQTEQSVMKFLLRCK